MDNVIIIPSLEPDNHLIKLVKELIENKFKYITVIDDGSGNNWLNIFKEVENLGCFVLYHKTNLGKGEAIKTGIRESLKKYPNIKGYITADADGQHTVKDIIRVSKEMDKHNNSIILGTRNFNKDYVPFKSRMGNKISSIFFKIKTGIKCNDTQTGLRGIPVSLTQFALNTEGSRFEYEMNFLMSAAKKRIHIYSISIETIYENNNRASHFKPFKDSILIYKEPLKFFSSSLISAITDILLFTILVIILPNNYFRILLSTAIARVSSGILNFYLNKRWSFKSNGSNKKEAFKYSLLFIFQLFASAFLTYIFSFIPIFITFTKILVDIILSIISYIIQKKYIFKRKDQSYVEKN